MPETTKKEQPDGLTQAQRTRVKAAPALEGAPEQVKAAAVGGKLSPDDERTALDWFLEPQRPLRYRAEVQFDTPQGLKPLVLVLRSLPQADMERIETRNRKGEGIMAEYDDFQANVEIVGEALVSLEGDGRSMDPADPRVLSGMPSVAEAMKARFYYQPGLIAGVASEVRRISGWGSDRVGKAERILTAAAGNS